MPNTYKKKFNATRKKYHGGGSKKKSKQETRKMPNKISKPNSKTRSKTPYQTKKQITQTNKRIKKIKKVKHPFNNKYKKPFINLKDETFRLELSTKAAELLVNGADTDFIFDELQRMINNNQKNVFPYGDHRAALAGSNADNECKTASKYWELHSNDYTVNCRNYIDYNQRDKIQKTWQRSPHELEYIDEKHIKKINPDNPKYPVSFNQENYRFDWMQNNDVRYMYPGKCWMCDEDVCFYFDKSGNKTGCGECEHVGSIMPSLLAGMLKQQDLSHFIYNYGFSHVHCNQNKGPKGNTTSMKFDHKELRWVNDVKATDLIINNILTKKLHTNEYCPFYRAQLNAWTRNKKSKEDQKEKIKITINGYTDIWILQANNALINNDLSPDNNEKAKDNAVKYTKVINYFVKRCLDNHSTAIKGGSLNHDQDFDISNSSQLNIFMDRIKKDKYGIYKYLYENLKESNSITGRALRASARATITSAPSGPSPAVSSSQFSPVGTASNQQGNVTGDQTRGSRMITNEGADSGSLEAAIMGEETDDDDRKE
tara:strand:+ start:2230 stop:3855 length:1626 start_codon:yes stop_codon:yes gene_type:complete